jgi:hypothetical protein
MIELVHFPHATGEVPKKRTTTIRTFKPRAPEGRARPLTRAELQFSLIQQVNVMRQDLLTQVKALFSKNEGQERDFKEIKREQQAFREILSSFGFRIAAIERTLKIATSTFSPAQKVAAGIVEPEWKVPRDAMLVAWEERISAAIKRLAELPDPCTPTQLAAHFGIPYSSLQKFWLRGQLTITRIGRGWITITRDAIAEYMNVYGVPCVKKQAH